MRTSGTLWAQRRGSARDALRLPDRIAGGVGLVEVVAEPVPLDLHLEARLQHRVARELAHVRWRESVDLGRDAVLLEQSFARECEHEGVVRRQADVEADAEIARQRIAVVGQEESVVAERRHGDANLHVSERSPVARSQTNLLEVEQILQSGYFAQEDAVRDRMRGQEGAGQMVGVAGLARVGPQDESVCGVSAPPTGFTH